MMCFVLFACLCLVRKIEVFAATHALANAMILITLISVITEGCITLNDGGSQLQTVGMVMPTFADGIGYSVFAYEGIGLIMPV